MVPEEKDYSPPPILFNRHLETIYPALFRRVNLPVPERERIITPDDDFLDLDLYRKNSETCMIISHGLEGNSSRAYVKGMARAAASAGLDVVAWNYRGCSGEINRQLRFYHSGATDDLDTVVKHVAKSYDKIVLVGFSLGGNLTLKYLGEPQLNPSVRRGIAISVPLDLHASCLVITRPTNWPYNRRFLKSLKQKVKAKASIRNDLDTRHLEKINNLMEFDDVYTGPVHGFKDAIDYYTRCSSIRFIDNIPVPTLILNALNDPFLSRECFPEKQRTGNANLHFEYPERGGHVGFARFGHNQLYWSEARALAFMKEE